MTIHESIGFYSEQENGKKNCDGDSISNNKHQIFNGYIPNGKVYIYCSIQLEQLHYHETVMETRRGRFNQIEEVEKQIPKKIPCIVVTRLEKIDHSELSKHVIRYSSYKNGKLINRPKTENNFKHIWPDHDYSYCSSFSEYSDHFSVDFDTYYNKSVGKTFFDHTMREDIYKVLFPITKKDEITKILKGDYLNEPTILALSAALSTFYRFNQLSGLKKLKALAS